MQIPGIQKSGALESCLLMGPQVIPSEVPKPHHEKEGPFSILWP